MRTKKSRRNDVNLNDWFAGLLKNTAHDIAIKIIANKFRDLGIILNDDQISKLKTFLDGPIQENYRIDLEDSQLLGSKINLNQKLVVDINSDDFNKIENVFNDVIKEIIPAISKELGDNLLNDWKKQAPVLLKKDRNNLSRFRSKLNIHWGKALDLLEMLLSISFDIGADFNNRYRPDASKNSDYKFEALTRLHSRGCQVGQEILTLLRGGYADGAHARWRTLHELSVVAYSLSSKGNDLAERYLRHSEITNYSEALQYQEHCKSLNYEPLEDHELIY